jgi:signal peptidase I
LGYQEVIFLYLLLAENNYISSREIKSLLDKNRISCEIVNCSSADALLDIAEKIAPDIVIIDFDLFLDDSVNIVKELRRHSAGAYILAFVDPDHYNQLHRAIEDGIDNYMVKPLQREDVLLRLKMGLQHQGSRRSSARMVDQASVAEPVQKTPPVTEETVADSKKMFEDLADLFGRQFEAEVGQPEESFTVTEKEAVKVAEMPQAQVETPVVAEALKETAEIGELKAEPTDLNLPELSPRPESDFSWPGAGDISSGVTTDAFKIEPTEESAAVMETDDQSLFGLSPEPEMPGTFNVPEVSSNNEPQELSLIDEAFSLVDSLEELDDIKMASDSVDASPELEIIKDPVPDLPYFDDLFTREPVTDHQSETDQTPVKYAPSVVHSKPETLFEKEPELPEAQKFVLDDKELFGMTSAERAVDRSSFEELFGAFDGSAKKQKRAPVEPKMKKGKEGKVEYLPFARKPNATAASIPVDEVEDLFKDQPVVKEKPKKQETKLQKTAKAKQKPPMEKKEQSSSNFVRVAGNIVTALLLIIMVGLSFFLIQSRLGGGSPAIAGYQMYVVLSGSMNPAFNTGSLVFVKPTEPLEIAEGDIITFSSSGDATRLTTHRVVGLNMDDGLSFITRGDANNVNDPSPVPAENVVGRVTGSVPYIGYLFGFAQTRQGLILLIFIPGLFLIIMELRRLFKYMVEAKVEQLKGSAPVDPASAGSSPVPQSSTDRSALPGSGPERSLEEFGF